MLQLRQQEGPHIVFLDRDRDRLGLGRKERSLMFARRSKNPAHALTLSTPTWYLRYVHS